jgi:hypothetical protein
MSNSLSGEKFQSPWYRGRGVIYFLAAGSPPLAVKIGVTKRDGVVRRLRSTQTYNHEIIELLGIIEFSEGERPLLSAERSEQALHRRFAALQRIEHGWVGHEWFTASDELLQYISTHSRPPEELDLPRRVARPKGLTEKSSNQPAAAVGTARRR